MVKRKEVKIDEEQIRSMMTEDIPAGFMEKIYGNNAAGSQKEEGKESETENQSGIPAVPDKVEDSGISTGEEVPPLFADILQKGQSQEKHAGKGTACRNIPNICLTTTL